MSEDSSVTFLFKFVWESNFGFWGAGLELSSKSFEYSSDSSSFLTGWVLTGCLTSSITLFGESAFNYPGKGFLLILEGAVV